MIPLAEHSAYNSFMAFSYRSTIWAIEAEELAVGLPEAILEERKLIWKGLEAAGYENQKIPYWKYPEDR